MLKRMRFFLKLRMIFVLTALGVLNFASHPVIAGDKTISIASQCLIKNQISQSLMKSFVYKQKISILNTATELHSAVVTYNGNDGNIYTSPLIQSINKNSGIIVERCNSELINQRKPQVESDSKSLTDPEV